jgi:hypothetical protein
MISGPSVESLPRSQVTKVTKVVTRWHFRARLVHLIRMTSPQAKPLPATLRSLRNPETFRALDAMVDRVSRIVERAKSEHKREEAFARTA